MIILKFTEGKPQAATIDRPYFYEGIYEILKEMYTGSIAERNAKEIAKYIRDNMQFPKDGLYCIEDGLFEYFESATSSWHCTPTSPIEYVITSDSSIWKCFESEFMHLQDMSDQIKEVVKHKTEEMFDVDEWYSVSSIDTRSWKFYYNQDGIAHMLESFFTEEKSIAIASDIRKQLFGVKDSEVVVVQEGSSIKSAITANDVIMFDENNIGKVEQIFRGKLKQSEIRELLTRLRNLLCFGQDLSLGEIIGFTKEGYNIIKYKGYEIVSIGDKPFIKVDEKVYADIKNAVDSIDFLQGAEKTPFGVYKMPTIQIDLTIPSENGIKLLASRNHMELEIKRRIPETWNSTFGEKFVELKYVDGKEKRTYYKETFIGHYVQVKL